MAKGKIIWKGFNAGELTPWMDGQVSFDKYYSGCKRLENFIPTVQGPAFNRPGFRYVTSAKYSNKKCRLIPFDFSTEQAYILEFGDAYIRFYKDRGQILSGSAAYEVSTTYTETEIPECQFVQSNDVLYIAHPNHFPASLSRTGHTSWTLEDLVIINQYFPSPSMITTSGFDNFSAANCVDEQYTTKAWDNNTDIAGQWLQIDTGATNKKEFTRISLYIEGAALNATFDIEYYDTSSASWKKAVTGWNLAEEPLGWVTKEWDSVGSHAKWRLYKTDAAAAGGDVMELELYEVGVPEEWGAGKYPSSIAFFEQRLWFAYKQTVWASKSGDFYNMTTGLNADHAMIYTIGATQVNKIQWLASGKILVVGTAGGEYKVSASSLDEAITPANIRIAKQSNIGSHYIEPVPIADVVLYLQRSKRKIREFTYNSLEDSFTSPDMTVLARHLFDSDVLTMSYQQEPYSILWCVMSDGKMLAFTYQRIEGITAWSQHTTDGLFESAACIYGSNGNNELWVVVNRTIEGVEKRYIELLEEPYTGNDIHNDTNCFFVDSGLTYNGPPATLMSGLDHLEGESVSILADGFVKEPQVVTNGQILLDTPVSIVHAGLPYSSVLQTMRPEVPDGEGTSQGRVKRINRCVFRLYNTKQFKYGASTEGPFKEITFDNLFSGDKEEPFPAGWTREGYVTIVNDNPVPIGVVAIIPEIGIN